MFEYVSLFIVLIAFVIISMMIFRKKLNPISIINFIYICWLILGRIEYLGQYTPSYESSCFIIVNIIIMDIAILLGYCIKFRNTSIVVSCFEKNGDKFIKWIRIVCLIISLAIFVNLILKLLSGEVSLSNIRYISYSLSYDSNSYTKIYYNIYVYNIYQNLIREFVLFDITYSFARVVRKERKISAISIINFVLFIIIMMSRIEILKLTYIYALILILYGIKLSNRQKKIIKRVSLFVAIFVVAVFISRSITSEKNTILNSFDDLIIDFSGSNYTFSKFYESYQNGFRLENSSAILLYFGGFGRMIEIILSFLGIPYSHEVFINYIGIATNIGSSNHYNAFYTMYIEFLNAGGFVACAIFSILLGAIIGHLFRHNQREKTCKSLYLAAFFVYIAIMGTYRLTYFSMETLVVLFGVLISPSDTAQK